MMRRLFRASFALAPLFVVSGCGYVHFGRLPQTATALGDAALTTAYSNLSTEHKILQQELVLARKEGVALRTALENRSPDGAASPELAARLNETSRELAALRASYAKLSETKSSATPAKAGDPVATAKLADLEEKLATSLRGYTQLQEENARLRTEVDRARTENTALTAQVKTISAENAQTQSALAQLNTELLAQKEARTRAEQQTAAAHAQLTAVLAQRAAPAPTLAGARETAADSAATLRVTHTPPSDAAATAELRTGAERRRAAEPTDAPPKAGRTYVVVTGDTLEKIAKKFYGSPERWRTIYAANNALLSGGRPVKPGMELEIPEE